MSAVENRRVEYRNSFSPGAKTAQNGYAYERLPGRTRVRENPLQTKLMVAERLEPFIRVSEDVFTELNLGPSLCSSCPYALEK